MENRRRIRKRRQICVLIAAILLIIALAAAGLYMLYRGSHLNTVYAQPQSESDAVTPDPQTTVMVFLPTNAPA